MESAPEDPDGMATELPSPTCTSRPEASSFVTLKLQRVGVPPTMMAAVNVSPTARAAREASPETVAADVETVAPSLANAGAGAPERDAASEIDRISERRGTEETLPTLPHLEDDELMDMGPSSFSFDTQ